MLVRPQEESTEIETYLSPLFKSHPDLFLQPMFIDNLEKVPQKFDNSSIVDDVDDFEVGYLLQAEDVDSSIAGVYELRQVRLYEGFLCTLDQARNFKDQGIKME